MIGIDGHAVERTWTPAKVELLKQAWENGDTAGEIGNQLGVNRSMVLGKIYRMRLEGVPLSTRNGPIQTKEERAMARKKVVKSWRERSRHRRAEEKTITTLTNKGNRLEMVERMAPLPMLDTSGPLPESRPCAILEFERFDARCRFPIADGPPALFCGAPCGEGSWCPSHRQIVYQPPRPRVDQVGQR